MKWYYKTVGLHTHVRVFMNGACCGNLVFRVEEFNNIKTSLEGEPVKVTVDEATRYRVPLIMFVNEAAAEG